MFKKSTTMVAVIACTGLLFLTSTAVADYGWSFDVLEVSITSSTTSFFDSFEDGVFDPDYTILAGEVLVGDESDGKLELHGGYEIPVPPTPWTILLDSIQYPGTDTHGSANLTVDVTWGFDPPHIGDLAPGDFCITSLSSAALEASVQFNIVHDVFGPGTKGLVFLENGNVLDPLHSVDLSSLGSLSSLTLRLATDASGVVTAFTNVNGAGFTQFGTNNSSVLQGGTDLMANFAAGTTVDHPIPTISEWGLIVMSLGMLTAGTMVFGRRRHALNQTTRGA